MHAVPHFDIEKLKPWEVFFADGKDYDCTQRGGIDTSLIILELKSDAWFKVDCQRKLQYGKAIRTLMIREGVHLLDYPRCCYTDGCGSMKHVEDNVIDLGINYNKIPPHSQSLNSAERIADQAWAAGRVNLAQSGAPPQLHALAVGHAMYMKLRMATTPNRGYLMPHEILTGKRPNIAHCEPFFTKTFVTVPKDKRAKMRKAGKPHIQAEEGNLVGWDSMWSNTAMVMLDKNCLVRSQNVIYDQLSTSLKTLKDTEPSNSESDKLLEQIYGWRDPAAHNFGKRDPAARNSTEPPKSTPVGDFDQIKTPRSGTVTMDDGLSVGDGNTLAGDSNTLPQDEALSDEEEPTVERNAVYSPSPQNSTASEWLECVEIGEMPELKQHSHNTRYDPTPRTSYQPGDTGMEPNTDSRKVFLATVDKLKLVEHKCEVFCAQLERASRELNAKSSTPDVMGHLIAAAELRYEAQKDMSWKKALADPDHCEPALKALESEMTSLQSTILTEILAGKPEYKIAVEKATPG